MNFLHHIYAIYIDRGFERRAQSRVQRRLIFCAINNDSCKHVVALLQYACLLGNCNQFLQRVFVDVVL